MKVKICGITRIEDAVASIDLGAEYLGFIFAPESPRFINPEAARDIIDSIRGYEKQRYEQHLIAGRCALAEKRQVLFVGVFTNQPSAEVRDMAQRAAVDLVQLHGDECADIADMDRPVIRALRIGEIVPELEQFRQAEWLLFDSRSSRAAGGTGENFDWDLLDRGRISRLFFLAGGLRPENIAEAIRRVQPHAVDVSSGVEQSPGIKDHSRLRALFEEIRKA
ncbi:MAG TPA: phosphoribosylanthranilate isomerase [Thermoanaerobaculia bacterium]|nr:phosphoribosylanthranilate isomerase [Thermoanaerobaculia bacterium]